MQGTIEQPIRKCQSRLGRVHRAGKATATSHSAPRLWAIRCSGAQMALLSNSRGCCQPMVDYTPESCHRPCLLVEEILKKSGSIQRGRIRIPFSVIPNFGHPFFRLAIVDHGKQVGGIQEGTASVTQNPELIGLDPNNNIRLPEREISVTPGFFPEFDDHR